MRKTVLVLVLAGGVLVAQGRSTAPQGPPIVASFEKFMVASPPAEIGVDPFYKKYADAFGIPIVASEKVDDAAVLLARDIVMYMTSKRLDARAEMIRRGGRVMIMARTEQQMDLPEYSTWTKPAIDDRRLTNTERENYNKPGGIGSKTAQEYWNNRARGMGGIRTSCAEENLLGVPGTKYYGEHICVHEFSHGIMSALQTVDKPLMEELQAAYADATAKNLYPGQYANNTIAEYWAEGTQWWFWSNIEFYDCATKVRVQTPDELKAYDPKLYAILDRVYPGHHVPGDVYYGRNLRPVTNRCG